MGKAVIAAPAWVVVPQVNPSRPGRPFRSGQLGIEATPLLRSSLAV